MSLPQAPINPTPADGVENVDFSNKTLSWENGGGAISYDVMLFPTFPGNDITISDITDTHYTLTEENLTIWDNVKGIADLGTDAAHLVDNALSDIFEDDDYPDGLTIKIISGTGKESSAVITGYTVLTGTILVDSWSGTPPTVGSGYVILMPARWRVVAKNQDGFDSSDWQFTFLPILSIPPIITDQSENQTAVKGQLVPLFVVTTGTAPLEYQWYKGEPSFIDGQIVSTSGLQTWGENTWYFQTFIALTSDIVTQIELELSRYGADIGQSITISIKATDVNGKPTGSDLGFGIVVAAGLPQQTQPGVFKIITLNIPVSIVVGTKYAIIIRNLVSDSGHYIQWHYNENSTYQLGNAKLGYSINAGVDWIVPWQGVNCTLCFKLENFSSTGGTDSTLSFYAGESDGGIYRCRVSNSVGDVWSDSILVTVVDNPYTWNPFNLNLDIDRETV